MTHQTVNHQLKQFNLEKDTLPSLEQWQEFIQRLEQTYTTSDEVLSEQRALLKQVLDINPALIFAKDRDGRFTLANKAMANVYGVTVEELIGKTDDDLVKNSARAEQFLLEDRKIMDSLKEKEAPMDVTVDLEGNTRRFLTTKQPIVGSDGVANQILGIVTDVTELIYVEDELRNSEVRTRLIVETALDAVISINDKGVITGWNQQAEKIFGWSQAEIKDKTLTETIIPERYKEAHQRGLKRFLTTGKRKVSNQLIEITAVHKDGHEFPVELSIAPVKTKDSYTFNAFLRDITKRKQAEEKITYQAESLTTINNIAEVLYHSLDIESIVEQSVDAIQTFTKAPVVGFYELIEEGEADQHYLKLLASRGISAATKKASQKLPLEGSLSGITIAQKAFVSSNDLLVDTRIEPKTAAALQNQGLKNVFSIPLLAQDRTVGVINFIYKETRTITTQEQGTLLAIGNTIGLALANAQHIKQVETEIIERKKLEEEIQASLVMRSRQVTVSTQIAQEIADAPNLRDLYKRIVNEIQEQFNYYHTQLLQYDSSLETMALVCGYGDVGEKMLSMHHSLPIGIGLIGQVAKTKESLLIGDVRNVADWKTNPLLPKTRCELAIPIKMREIVLGVLDIQSDKVNGITKNDQLLLEGLCGQIAIAIDSTRLRQDIETNLNELQTLQRQISREGWIGYQEKYEDTYGFGYDNSGVFAISGDKTSNNGHRVKPKNEEMVQTQLSVRGEIIGEIKVQEDPERPLTEEERSLLDAISEQVAEALEAARLFEETQIALSEQERLTADLETVAQVSAAASTILDLDPLIQSVVDLAKNSFGLYHAHCYLADEEGAILYLVAGAGSVGRLMVLEGRDIHIRTESIVARAARNQKGILENNVRKVIDFLPHPLLPLTEAEMAIPMIVGDKLIGVIDLQSDVEGFFTEEDLKIQQTLASQIGIAIENARQYAKQVETAIKLREVDQLKSEFLASMSHELRTPLNSIIGFADVLLEGLDGELNDRMEEDVRLIRQSGRHLRDLIGDILDMSKIESGHMELRRETVDMRMMAEDIMATAQSLANEKSLAMYLNMDESVHTIEGDSTRIRQVLWNIMGNAIKFTDKGSVTLKISSKAENLLISVRDTGIGIKEEHIPIVFQQFRQVEGGLARAAGGTGLGMPITKNLVEIQGGSIWIESVLGQGSTFFFTLPYIQPQKAEVQK